MRYEEFKDHVGVAAVGYCYLHRGPLVVFHPGRADQYPVHTVAGMVIALVLLSVVVAVRRIKTENAGLPADDELSQQIKIKSAAYAFAFSFMLWILVLLFSGQAGISGETMIGIGIAGMGLLFLGFWGYFSQKGIADENPH